MALYGWTVLIIIYFFSQDSVSRIWKLSFLDHTPVKIVAIGIMSLSFLLHILFTVSVGRSIRSAVSSGEKPRLITTGLYRFCRHPAYLALLCVALGIFLIVPNLISLILLVYTIVVTYGHSVEEEGKLLKMYGSEYENYRKKAGRFLPNCLG
jgi:protein-S-isoprenylcysteine O-methyltransferase Ste14